MKLWLLCPPLESWRGLKRESLTSECRKLKEQREAVLFGVLSHKVSIAIHCRIPHLKAQR